MATAASTVGALARTPTQMVSIPRGRVAYRELGASNTGTPLVALTHLGANLDSWDPEAIEPLAAERRVIMIGYRGVGDGSGDVRDTFEAMADDVIASIRALGIARVDLLGLSMGGMVAQALLDRAPGLVDRIIVAGSAPQGGVGLNRMSAVMARGIIRGALTFTPATSVLFFTRSRVGRRAAREYQSRLRLRRTGRDAPVALSTIRTQLRAVRLWGDGQPADSAATTGPVLILHGADDRMVPVANAQALLARFPDARLRIFPDSGHGVVPQNRRAVVDDITRFLQR